MVRPEAKRQRIYVILNPLEQVLWKRLDNLKLSYQNNAMIKMSDAVFSCLSRGIWMERVILPLCMSLERAFLEYSVQFWQLYFEKDIDKLE